MPNSSIAKGVIKGNAHFLKPVFVFSILEPGRFHCSETKLLASLLGMRFSTGENCDEVYLFHHSMMGVGKSVGQVRQLAPTVPFGLSPDWDTSKMTQEASDTAFNTVMSGYYLSVLLKEMKGVTQALVAEGARRRKVLSFRQPKSISEPEGSTKLKVKHAK